MELFWLAIEYACCLIESLFAFFLFSRHLGCSGRKRSIAIALIPVIAAFTYLQNRLELSWYVVSLIVLLVLIAYSFFLFDGSKASRLLWGAAPSIVFLITDNTVQSIMLLSARWHEAMLIGSGVRLIGLAIYIALLLLTLLVFVSLKRIEGELPPLLMAAPIVVASLAIVGILIQSKQYAGLMESGIDPFPFALTNLIVSILCASSTLLLRFASVHYKKSLDSQRELQQRKLEAEHIDQIGSMYEFVREWRHDINGLLSTVDSLAREQNYTEIHRLIGAMDAAAKETAVMLSTGNPAIDATVSGKLMAAREAGIAVNSMIGLPPAVGIDLTDVCSVLINLMDNAIRAARQLDEGERTIDLCIACEERMLKITVKNPCLGEYSFSDGKLLSTKDDDLEHGIGLKRVRRIAEKHGGYFKIEPLERSFKASVLLPLEKSDASGEEQA